jgi:hypothetical protein
MVERIKRGQKERDRRPLKAGRLALAHMLIDGSTQIMLDLARNKSTEPTQEMPAL